MSARRTPEFAKDLDYESLLEDTNRLVEGWGEQEGAAPERPVVFVVGPPRSGTTLLYQLLAASQGFLYPSNIVARFYRSPAWGVRIQRLLEPVLPGGEWDFTSRAGRTTGWWGPHEFGYFWEHHFDFSEHHEPPGPAPPSLARALAALETEDDRPLLFKSNLLSFVVQELARLLPTARFVRMRRPSIEVADSIHRTRIRFAGDPAAWWSIRPGDAPLEAPPAEQIAHQIHRVETALDHASDALGERMAVVDYRELCADPRAVVSRTAEAAGAPSDPGAVPPSFTPSDTRSDDAVRESLEATLRASSLW